MYHRGSTETIDLPCVTELYSIRAQVIGHECVPCCTCKITSKRHATSRPVIHTSDLISQMEEKLAGLPFLRVHRSAIANLEHMREVRSAGSDYDFLLTADMRVTSGCTYERDIHALISSWKKVGDKRIG
jgi:LytTr DNA-binding domain